MCDSAVCPDQKVELFNYRVVDLEVMCLRAQERPFMVTDARTAAEAEMQAWVRELCLAVATLRLP